jgi:hypothetical protein
VSFGCLGSEALTPGFGTEDFSLPVSDLGQVTLSLHLNVFICRMGLKAICEDVTR